MPEFDTMVNLTKEADFYSLAKTKEACKMAEVFAIKLNDIVDERIRKKGKVGEAEYLALVLREQDAEKMLAPHQDSLRTLRKSAVEPVSECPLHPEYWSKPVMDYADELYGELLQSFVPGGSSLDHTMKMNTYRDRLVAFIVGDLVYAVPDGVEPEVHAARIDRFAARVYMFLTSHSYRKSCTPPYPIVTSRYFMDVYNVLHKLRNCIREVSVVRCVFER